MTTQPTQKAKLLSQHYYHDNFNELIAFVSDNYWQLLDDREKHFFTAYQSIRPSAQQLYCRLLMRKRDHFRVSKTVYPEINQVADALTELADQQFCIPADTNNVQSWAELFNREEMHSALPVAAPARRSQWLSDSAEACAMLLQKDLFGCSPVDLLLRTDSVFRVAYKDAFINFQLLFFGDLYQDISAFVLRDLGFTRYETTLHKDLPLPFSNRAQLLAHRHYYECIDNYDDTTKSDPDALLELHQQLLAIPPEIVSSDNALRRRLQKWSNRIARQLERLDAIEHATAIYQTTDRPPARERLARIHARHGHPQQAFSICKAIIDNPHDAAELDFAEQFAQPLAKTLNADFKKVEKYTPPIVSLTLPSFGLPVEYAAALHYAKTGKCFYVENSLITGIFGLVMWDIIFAPIEGAFYHPFQTAPADFREAEFTDNRRHLFETRLQQIQHNGLSSLVLPNLHTKQGISNPLVNWYVVSRQLVILAIARIPLANWITLFEQLLRDIPAHRSGLPDLIYFADSGGYELLEVKGPGDQLQKHQRRWMKHFAANDIPHAVVDVKFAESEGLAVDGTQTEASSAPLTETESTTENSSTTADNKNAATR